MLNPTVSSEPIVIGVDLGTKKSAVCVLIGKEVAKKFEVRTRSAEIQAAFAELPQGAVVMEVGTCSRWVSQLIRSLGFQVEVVAAESLRRVFKGTRRRKTDQRDAESLARLFAADPKLLRKIEHRPDQMHRDLCRIKARDQLIRQRTQALLFVRGILRALGVETTRMSSESFVKQVMPQLSDADRALVFEHCFVITSLNNSIRALDREIEHVAKERYPETALLSQVTGVGTITALTYRLVVANTKRFAKNRDVAAYLGLIPQKTASGDEDPELGISKTGDELLRRLLVQCAHYIIGSRCRVDSDLRRFGLALAARGKKAAKRRAAVAVARKLAVLLLSLWKSGAEYVPLKNSSESLAAA